MPVRDVDAYIATFPRRVQTLLRQVRATIREAAPGAEERISYRMPAFELDGMLAWIGAFKQHIGFYPPVRDPKLAKQASLYAGDKGNLRFPFDQPMPLDLIARIVASRVRENRAKAAAKKKSAVRAGTPAKKPARGRSTPRLHRPAR